MAQHMTSPSLEIGYIDKRRTQLATDQTPNTTRVGRPIFTCNATGTTTTALGADAAPATNDNNVVRRGESFKIYNASGVAKEEKIFRITNIASATGTTTVTFSPAAATAPVNTDVLRRVGQDQYDDISDLDFRLNQIDSSYYTQTRLDQMTVNDKVYALRNLEDAGSLP